MPPARPLAAGRYCPKIGQYLNTHFGGNLSTAARVLGTPYGPLRRAALGLARRPSVDLLMALHRHAQLIGVSQHQNPYSFLGGWVE
jgi:hypothetical protein